MGEDGNKPVQLTFNGFQGRFPGSRVTSDGGLVLIRELDERLGLGKLIDEHLSDTRQARTPNFRWRIWCGSRSNLGWRARRISTTLYASPPIRRSGCWAHIAAVHDVERTGLGHDLVEKKNWDRGGALTSRLQSFETGMLAGDNYLIGLMAVNRELIGQAEAADDSERVVLDMDSTESPVHGQQEGSAYNRHFESVCCRVGSRLVADELAAPSDENRWPSGQTCTRYYWLLLAEGHLNRRLFGEILGRLAALPVPGG